MQWSLAKGVRLSKRTWEVEIRLMCVNMLSTFWKYKYSYYTKITEVNLSIFVYKLFREVFTLLIRTNDRWFLNRFATNSGRAVLIETHSFLLTLVLVYSPTTICIKTVEKSSIISSDERSENFTKHPVDNIEKLSSAIFVYKAHQWALYHIWFENKSELYKYSYYNE